MITREADLSTLPADTPPHLRTLIARCLVKDPKQRLRDVGEARLALDGESIAAASGVQPLLSADRPRQEKRWLQATTWTFVALLGGAAAYQVWSATRVSTDPPVLRLSIPLDVRPALFGLSLALAPDGHALVVQASWSSGDRRLFLRRLNGSSFEALPGTENAAGPFWSPDSGSIAFVVDGQLKRIDLATSSVRRISSAPAAGCRSRLGRRHDPPGCNDWPAQSGCCRRRRPDIAPARHSGWRDRARKARLSARRQALSLRIDPHQLRTPDGAGLARL